MKIRLAPSIARADLLHMGDEIHKLEVAGVELLHYDMMDTSYQHYGTELQLPTDMVPQLRRFTDIPLDIHLMVARPDQLAETVLPHSAGCFVSFQPEVCPYTTSLLKTIERAGALPGLAINIGTPLSVVAEAAPYLRLVNILLRDQSESGAPIHPHVMHKIAECRRLLDSMGRSDVSIEVDGSIRMEEVRPLAEAGADILVLGTKTVFRPGKSYAENCAEMRALLE